MSHLCQSAAIYSITVSVADPDTRSGAFLNLGSGIRNRFFRISDPGSQTNIFDCLMTNFGVKSMIILNVLAKKMFLFKNRINYNFMTCGYKKLYDKIFSPSPLLVLLLDPGWVKSGSGINIPDPQH